MNDTASAFYLDGEGMSKKEENKEQDISKEKLIPKSGNKDKYSNRIISSVNTKNTVPVYGPDGKRIKNTKESRAMRWIKKGKAIAGNIKHDKKSIKSEKRTFAIKLTGKPVGNIRVPVLSPDGQPLMPTKSSRRKLHNEQPSKGGVRRRFGGTTTDWTNVRKGDYIEAVIDKRDVINSKMLPKHMMYRGWVGGYENDKKLISVYNFDWKVIGQFDSRKVRLLDRNHGLLIKSLDISKDRMEICKFGTVQADVEKAWG